MPGGEPGEAGLRAGARAGDMWAGAAPVVPPRIWGEQADARRDADRRGETVRAVGGDGHRAACVSASVGAERAGGGGGGYVAACVPVSGGGRRGAAGGGVADAE